MACSRTLSFTAVLLAGGMHVLNPASAQNINDFQRTPGGIERASQSEWRRLAQSEISCLDKTLRQQGGNVNDLINRGVMPSDPRLTQLRSNCRRQIAQRPQPVTAQPPHPVTAQLPRYVVEGLTLGGRVRFEDKTNRRYQCVPSEFPGLTWCHEEEAQNNITLGKVTSSNSILHTQDGKAVYVNSYVEPALITPNDVRKQIDRLSAKFGEHAREFRMPQREGFPDAVIAIWGKIQLEPLDPNDIAMVASGVSPKGLLVSFLGDLQQAAKAGVPVFRLAGGAGFLWGATFSDNARGAQRFLTIDASKIASPMATNYPLRELSEPHVSTPEPLPASPPIALDASAGQLTSVTASDNPVKSPTEGQAVTSENAGAGGPTTDRLDAVRPGAERLQRNDAEQAADQENLEDNPSLQMPPANGFSESHTSSSEPMPALPPIRPNAPTSPVTSPAASDNPEKSPTERQAVTSKNAPARSGLAIEIAGFTRRMDNSDPVRPAADEPMPQSNNTDAVAARSENLNEPRSQKLGLIAILTTILLLGLAVTVLFVGRHNSKKRRMPVASTTILDHKKIAPAVNRIERAAGVTLPMECTSSDKMKSANEMVERRPWPGSQASMSHESKSQLPTTAGNSVSKTRLYSGGYSGTASESSVVRDVENTASTAIPSHNRKVATAVTGSEKTAHLVIPMEPVSFDRTNQSADETVRPQLALVSKRSIGPENKDRLLTTADDSPYRNEVGTDSYVGEVSEISSEKNASENAIVEKGVKLAKLYAVGNPSNEELDALKLLISEAFGVYTHPPRGRRDRPA
jgi:hypothetical protein